jgi:hypothetical protein
VGTAVGVVVPKDVKISLPFSAGGGVGVVVSEGGRVSLPFAVGESPEPEGVGVSGGGIVVVVWSSHCCSPLLVLLLPPAPVPLSLPVRPPWTPAAWKRARASSLVSHERMVPCSLTRGRATHIVPEVQGVSAHAAATHCANCWLTQAVEPVWQESVAVRLAN